MKVREESEETGLKLNIQKTKIMASGPITSWQIDGETVEAVTDLIFLDSKITAAMKLKDSWEGGSGWGTQVHPWRIHVNVWQNQYNIVK